MIFFYGVYREHIGFLLMYLQVKKSIDNKIET